jgi:hypothetical protein
VTVPTVPVTPPAPIVLNGAPIVGAPADPAVVDPAAPPATGAPAAGDDPLGAAGVQALEAFKARARAAEAENRAWSALGVTPEQARAALAAAQAPPAGEPVDPEAIREAARREVAAELTTAANRRVLEADVRAALVGKVGISPESAVALMRQDIEGITIGADGRANPVDVADAVRALLTREPALAAVATPGFAPVDQGPRGGGSPKTLTEQIADAKAAGNMRLAIALERSKLAQ